MLLLSFCSKSRNRGRREATCPQGHSKARTRGHVAAPRCSGLPLRRHGLACSPEPSEDGAGPDL